MTEQQKYRSKPERDIADLLTKYDIPFIYEKPTAVVDDGKTKLWYPDFTLAYGLLVEYFGVNGNQGYRDRTKHKLKVYRENQIPVLQLYPQNMQGNWEPKFLSRLDKTLENQVKDYRTRIARPFCAPSSGQYSHRPVYQQ
ncbi:hypothetical protein BVX94_02300 [bacterium B17]|nr:hypothetical protein BVX94_02300 [bacterium B17]